MLIEVDSQEYVEVDPFRNDGVAVIRLCHPPVNSLNLDVLGQLNDAVRYAADDSEVKGIVLASDGDVFSAGADLRAFAPLIGPKGQKKWWALLGLSWWLLRRVAAQLYLGSLPNETEIRKLLERGKEFMQNIEDVQTPVVAAVNGPALGGGLELLTYCHGRVGTSNAVFRLPEVLLGIIPGWGGTYRLPYLLKDDPEIAMRMVANGMPLGAEDAVRCGLLNKLVPEEQLIDEAAALALLLRDKRLLAMPIYPGGIPKLHLPHNLWNNEGLPPQAHRLIRNLLAELSSRSADEARWGEEDGFIDALVHPDSIKGLQHAKKNPGFSSPAPFHGEAGCPI